MNLLFGRAITFWLMTSTALLGIHLARASVPPLQHGGILQERNGLYFEVVRNDSSRRLEVYASPEVGKAGNELVIYIKRGIREKIPIKLRLSSTQPDSVLYTGLIPSRIQISGGMEFEIGSLK